MCRSDRSSLHVFQTAARQADVLRMVFGTGDDARLVVGRQTHRLRLVELGILKCRQPKQSIAQARRQPVLGDVDLIAENQFKALGQRPGNRRFLPAARGRRSPRLGILLIRQGNAHADNPPPPLGITNNLLDGGAIDLADRSTGMPIDRDKEDTCSSRKTLLPSSRGCFCSGNAIRLPKPPWGSVS